MGRRLGTDGVLGWSSDPDAHGNRVVVCSRAVSVIRSGEHGATAHLTRRDRLELIGQLAGELAATTGAKTEHVGVRPSLRWLGGAAMLGALATTLGRGIAAVLGVG